MTKFGFESANAISTPVNHQQVLEDEEQSNRRRQFSVSPNCGKSYSSGNRDYLECPTLCVYGDADYAGCIQTRRSTAGYCLLFGKGVVSWCSEQQPIVSHSTAESEYIAASYTSRELVWLKRLLEELNQTMGSENPTLFVDNESAVKMMKNLVLHKRTKHIRENFHKNVFKLNGISNENQLADILTKPLPKTRFENLRSKLNVIPINIVQHKVISLFFN